jgi:hypothetical protein
MAHGCRLHPLAPCHPQHKRRRGGGKRKERQPGASQTLKPVLKFRGFITPKRLTGGTADGKRHA